MKVIDIDNWKRKDHYKFFKQFDYPHFSISGNVDITNYYKHIKENELPFFISMLYASTKAANGIKEFRQRIREDKVIEHEIINPSFTMMSEDELFSFCTVKFMDDFNEFKSNTLKEMEKTKTNIKIEDELDQDDLLFITSIPWISFTNLTHPINMNPVDSVPRVAWGKYFEENGKIKLPLNVQAHHAFIDGVHIGQYFNNFQKILDNPKKYL